MRTRTAWLGAALVAAGCGGVVSTPAGDADVPDTADAPGADADAPVDRPGTEDAPVDRPGAEDADAVAPRCGDGIVQGGEECDDGNDVRGDGCDPGCTTSCHERADCDDEDPCTEDRCVDVPAGRACEHGPAAGEPCDDGNPCTEGDSCDAEGACVPGPNTCECTGDADCERHEDDDLCNGTLVCEGHVCVVDEATVVVCPTGEDTDCRKNTCDPDTGACSPQAVREGEPCDDGKYCTTVDTCSAGACTGTGTPCGLSCETCDEGGRTCKPAEGWCVIGADCVAGGTVNAANACEWCDPGAGAAGWSPRPAGTSCADGTYCDGQETCDGAGACVDGPAPCAPGGCVEGCDEARDGCAAAGSSVVCRPAEGACDIEERCDGTSLACPADVLEDAGTICRAAEGDCDIVEFCSGTSAECGPDRFRGSTHVCRPAEGDCDADERCPGGAAACPPDALRPPGFVCRLGGGACNPAEVCSGTSRTCPEDEFRPDGTSCDDHRPCTGPDACHGGACVALEECDGLDNDCNGLTDEGVSCTDYGGFPICPGGWGWTMEGCVSGQCRQCTCGLELVWRSCGSCGGCPY